MFRAGHDPRKAVTDAGFTRGEAGEIVADAALSIFSNYFTNVANTQIDFPRVDLAKIASSPTSILRTHER
jgi:hypothetical protein